MPLIRFLQDSGKYEIVVSGADTNTLRRGDVDPRALIALSIPYVPFEALATWSEVASAMRCSIRTPRRATALLRNEAFWEGLALDDATSRLIRAPLIAIVGSQLPKIILYLALATALYRRLQPSLVVVTDESLPVLGRVSLRRARRHGAATLTVQHGLMLDDPMYYGAPVADRFAVWSPQARDFLVAHDASTARIEVVGSTRFGRPRPHIREIDWTTLGLNNANKAVLLFTSQPGGRDVSKERNLATLVCLAKAVKESGTQVMVVKPHPTQTAEELNQWRAALETSGAGEVVRIAPDLPLHEAMMGSDLVVTIFSTTGLEALWLDRPLLCVNLTKRPDPLPYAEEEAAVVVHHPNKVRAAIAQALDPSDQAARAAARRRFVEHYLGPQDGRALERLGAIVDDLIDQC